MTQTQDAEPMLVLIDFVDKLLDDPTEEGLTTTLAAFPSAGAALIDHLEGRFVRLEAMTSLEDRDEWWMALELLASHWGEAERRAFLEKVGLRAAAPEAYRWLAAFFRVGIPVDTFEPWLLRGLEQGSDTEKENASHLAYYLFDGTEGYALSPEGEARLEAADAELRG